MAYNSSNRSERLLQGRRFTTDNLTLSQEAFTDVFDLGASEILTDDGLIPSGSSQLPYSGSSQNLGIVSASVVDPAIETDLPILKYWYRKKLKPAGDGSREVYYFTTSDPSAVDDTVTSDQLIETDQQINFVSPKYIIASDSVNTAESVTPGYVVVVYKSTSATAVGVSEDAANPSTYVFDYKTGILTWNDGSAPTDEQYVYITVYQYVGRTLRSQIDDGTIGGGSGFPFSGSAQITGSLLVSGSGTVSTIIGSSLVTQDLTVQGRILDSQSLAFWGAVGDGVTNDTLAIQTALNSNTASAQVKSNDVTNLTGGTVIYGEPGKTYLIGDTITVPTNVRFDLNQSRIYVTGSYDAVRLKPWSRLENGSIIISESLDYTDKSAILLLASASSTEVADVFFPSIRRLYETTAGISNMNLRGPGLIPNNLIYGDLYGPVEAKLTGNAILLKAEANEHDKGPNINATKFHDFEINGFGYGIHIESINSYGVGAQPYISNNQFSNFGLKNNAYGIYIYNSQTPDTQISESAGFGSGEKAGALASSNVFSNFWYNPVTTTHGSLHAIVNYGEKNIFDNFFLIDHKNAFTGSVADGGSPFKASSPQFFSPSSGNRLNDAINDSPDATDEEIDFVPAAIVDLNPQGGNVYNGEFTPTHVQDRSYTGFNKYNTTRFDEFLMTSPIDNGVTLPPYHLKGLPVGDQNDYLAFAYERGFGISQSRYPDSATGSRYDDISQGISTVFEPYGNGFVRYNSVTESVELTLSFPQEEFNSYIREYERLGDNAEYYRRSDNRFFKGLAVRFKEQKDFTNDSVSDYYQTPEHVKISVIQRNRNGDFVDEYPIYEYNDNKTLFLGNVGKKAFEAGTNGGFWDVKVMFSSSTAQDNPVVLERISCWLGTDDNKAYIKRSDDYYYGGLEFKPVYGRNADGTVDTSNVLREATLTAGDVSIGGFSSVSSSLAQALLGGGIVQLSNISQSNDISYEERVNKLVVYVSSSESFLVNSSDLNTTVFQTETDGTIKTDLLTTTNALLPFVGSNFERWTNSFKSAENTNTYDITDVEGKVSASIRASGRNDITQITITNQFEPLYPGDVLVFSTQSLGYNPIKKNGDPNPIGTDLRVLLHDGWSDRRSWNNISGKNLNVLDFGAVGDGIADDADVIQQVLDLAGEWEFGEQSVNSIFLPQKKIVLSPETPNATTQSLLETTGATTVKLPQAKTFKIGKTIYVPKNVTLDLNGSRLFITGSYHGVFLWGGAQINNGFIDISSSVNYKGKGAITTGFDDTLEVHSPTLYGHNNWWNRAGVFYAGGKNLQIRGPGPYEAGNIDERFRESYDLNLNGYGIYVNASLPPGINLRELGDGSSKQYSRSTGYSKFEHIKFEAFNDAIRLETSCSGATEYDMASLTIDLSDVVDVSQSFYGRYLRDSGGINNVLSENFSFVMDGYNKDPDNRTIATHITVTGSNDFTDGLNPNNPSNSTGQIAQYFIYRDGSNFHTDDGSMFELTVQGYGQALVNKINSVYSGSNADNQNWIDVVSASYINTAPSGSIKIDFGKYPENIGVRGNGYRFRFLSGSSGVKDDGYVYPYPAKTLTNNISPTNGFTANVQLFTNNNIFKDVGIVDCQRGIALVCPQNTQFEISKSLYGLASGFEMGQNIFENILIQASPISNTGYFLQGASSNRIHGSIWDWYDAYESTGSADYPFNPTSSNYSERFVYHQNNENEPPSIVIDDTSESNIIEGGFMHALVYENSLLQNKNQLKGQTNGNVRTMYADTMPVNLSYRPNSDQHDFFANLASKYGSYITYSSEFDQQFDSENSSKANMFIAGTTKDTVLLNMTSSNFTASFDIDILSIADEIIDSQIERNDFVASLYNIGISFTPIAGQATSQFPVIVPRHVKIEAVSGDNTTTLVEKKENSSDTITYQKDMAFNTIGGYNLGNSPSELKFRFTIFGSDMAKRDTTLLNVEESVNEHQIRINRVFASFGSLGNAFVKSSGDKLVGKYTIVSSSTDPGIVTAENIKVSVLDFGASKFSSREETPAFLSASKNDNSGPISNTRISAIQSAINFVSESGGGTVYVPKGVYPIQYPVAMKDNVTLEGEGEGSVIYNVFGANSIIRSPAISLGQAEELELRECQRYPFADISAGDRDIQITNTASIDSGDTFNGLDFSVGDIIYVRSSPNPLTPDEKYASGAEYLEARKVINITPTAPSGALVTVDRIIEKDLPFREGNIESNELIPFTNPIVGPSRSFITKLSGTIGFAERYTVKNATIKNIRLASKVGYAMVRTAAYECSMENVSIDARDGIINKFTNYSVFDNILLSDMGDRLIESNVGSSNNIYSNIRGIRDNGKNNSAKFAYNLVQLNESETLRDSYFETSVLSSSAYTANRFLNILGSSNTIDNTKFRGFVDVGVINFANNRNYIANSTFDKSTNSETGSTAISDTLGGLALLFQYSSSFENLEYVNTPDNIPASITLSFDNFEYGTGTNTDVSVDNFFFRLNGSSANDKPGSIDAVFYTTSSTNPDLGLYDGERFSKRDEATGPPTFFNEFPAYYVSESFSDVKQYGQKLAEKINYAFSGSFSHYQSIRPEDPTEVDSGFGSNIYSASFDDSVGESGSLFISVILGNNTDGTGSISQARLDGSLGNNVQVTAGSGSYDAAPTGAGRILWPDGSNRQNFSGGVTWDYEQTPSASNGVLSIDFPTSPDFTKASFSTIDVNGENHEELLDTFGVGDSIDFYNYYKLKIESQAEIIFRSSSFNVTNPSNEISSTGSISFNGTISSNITSASIAVLADTTIDEYPDSAVVGNIAEANFEDRFNRFVTLAIGDTLRIYSGSIDPITEKYIPYVDAYMEFTIDTISGSLTGSSNEVQIINYTGTTTDVIVQGSAIEFNTSDFAVFTENPAEKELLSSKPVRLNIEYPPHRQVGGNGNVWYFFSGSSLNLSSATNLTGSDGEGRDNEFDNRLAATLIKSAGKENILQNNKIKFIRSSTVPLMSIRGTKNLITQNSFEVGQNTEFRIQNNLNTISFNNVSGSRDFLFYSGFDYDKNVTIFNKNESDFTKNTIDTPVEFTRGINGNTSFKNGIIVTSSVETKGGGVTSETNALLIQNVNNDELLKVTDDGTLSITGISDVSQSIADAAAGGTAPPLQNVLDSGNTATEDINLTGGIITSKSASIDSIQISGGGSNSVILRTDPIDETPGGSVVIGDDALNFSGSVLQNVAIGRRSQYENTGSSYNVSVGTFSLLTTSASQYNTAIGFYAGGRNAELVGSNNTFLGAYARYDASAGDIENSTAVGYGVNLTDSHTVILGSGSTEYPIHVGIGTTSPSKELEVVGDIAITDFPSVSASLAQSLDTGSLMITGSVSSNTLTFTKGDGSTFDLTVAGGGGGGSQNLQDVLDTGNTATEDLTLNGLLTVNDIEISTGSHFSNTAIGNSALTGAELSIGGTALGYFAMNNSSGSYSTAVGRIALQNNSGSYSNGIGYLALQNNQGENCSGFGSQALQNNTGPNSLGFGHRTLENNTGPFSLGFGYRALAQNTGSTSSGFGYKALEFNSGSFANAFGYQSLKNNTSDNCTAVGHRTLENNAKQNNTALGAYAGQEPGALTGQNNVFLGYDASYGTNTTVANSVALGALTTVAQSYTVILGRETQTAIKVGIGTNTPSSKLHIKGAGATSGTTSLLVEDSAGADLLKVTDDGTVAVNNTLNVSDLLNMTPIHPLPTTPAPNAGTFAVSSSGVNTVKPYFYDGTSWNSLY